MPNLTLPESPLLNTTFTWENLLNHTKFSILFEGEQLLMKGRKG